METATHSIQNLNTIFHPTDFSHGSEVAFAHALRLAFETKADLDILHVDRHPGEVQSHDFPSVHDTLVRWQLLPEGASRADIATTGMRVHKTTTYGVNPADAILRHLSRHPADLIVLATHRRSGLDRWLHKEVANKIATLSQAATLFVPYGIEGFVRLNDGSVSLRQVVLPATHDPRPQPAVDCVGTLVRAVGCEDTTVTVLHVGPDEDRIPTFRFPHKSECEWEWLLRSEDVVSDILSTCELKEADLIVMTTQGHDGFLDAIRGSTTEQVLQQAQCPLLAVPARQLQREQSRSVLATAKEKWDQLGSAQWTDAEVRAT